MTATVVTVTTTMAAMRAAGMTIGIDRRMTQAIQVVVPQRIQQVVVMTQGIQVQRIQVMMMMTQGIKMQRIQAVVMVVP